MSKRILGFAAAALMISACHQTSPEQQSSNAEQPISETPPIPPPGTGPDAKTPLGEPKGSIDPKSVEAAGQVVQQFGALIEQNRFADAARLWGSIEAAVAFAKDLNPSTHLEIGELGQTEGAAGSIYTTIPVVFYGDTFRRPAKVILRRINDVPGSTEVQRRWHIERIDWSGPA